MKIFPAVLAMLWVGTSAVSARPIKASTDPVADEPAITEKDRQHWAFQPLVRPKPPTVLHPEQVRNGIDLFILARLEDIGLAFSPQADPATLIRRVTFDLTGLPPTAAEVQAFLQDPSDKAYEALVDRLLASERYGENQAQSWLDLARYAETDGFEHDLERKHSWRYRDWVVQAFNRDLPYDQFVQWQLAGDELTEDQAVATGFLMSGPDMPDINNQEERRHVLLNEITTTVGATFLGLTIGCAQCHDHPYDPLSQADFYRLRAYFDNLTDLKVDKQLPPAMVERGSAVQATPVSIRGDFRRPGPAVSAGVPRIAGAVPVTASDLPRSKSTGQRTMLARWLTEPGNGLFLRATANRLWQQHFVKALAGSPADMGTQGEPPTHPDLLDWLATELPRQNWSLKRLHKTLVMSATYRQASVLTAHAAPLKEDPQNLLYSRMNRHRLTGEALRDALLTASGQLNLKSGGPSVRLPLPAEVAVTLRKEQSQVTPDQSEHGRRSIYVFARRNLRYPLFEIFDRPDALATCARREVSTTAPQSLMLMNSPFSLEVSRKIAALVLTDCGTEPSAVVEAACQRCLSRKPTAQETTLGLTFLERQGTLTTTFEEVVSDYCLALINSSAFCYID